ncbi:unnamed protein product [Phytophthora lilii]|uniref:Unnamed protein product n=1 Tax=Phytophthora lilii TaxID=2077276 RepID=A0A9W6X754_9STRA|nr:unnamed protein product [Phytophthora lilii]
MGELEYRVGGRRQDSLQEEGECSELLKVSIADSDEVDPEEDPVELKKKLYKMVAHSNIWSRPWLGWCFTYYLVLLFFSLYRWTTFEALIKMYGGVKDNGLSVQIRVLILAYLEDVVCATYFVCAMWIFDLVKQAITDQCRHQGGRRHASFEMQKRITRIVSNVVTFVVSWILFVVIMVPFVSDMLLIRFRELRFTIEILELAYNEIEFIKAAPISKEEFNAAYLHGAIISIVAIFFATVRARASWADLASWNPTHMMDFSASRYKSESRIDKSYSKLPLDEVPGESKVSKSHNVNISDEPELHIRLSQAAVLLIGLVIFPMFVVGVSRSSSTLIAYSALNVTLSQLFSQLLPSALEESIRIESDIDLPWAETFIHHQTEEHELFEGDSLFRRTTGFRGDLAFDVDIDPENPPNVVLISLESFRYHDSHYIVGQEDPSNLFKGSDITVTPNFDRWAQRGVAFRNMWSSTPSSRSLESVLYAQVPYDNVAKTAIAGGRNETELYGLPQLFSAKGYETYFTTGSSLSYDDWDTFLPSHGFDTVWSWWHIEQFAQNDHGFTQEDWDGPAKRSFGWGLHDDITFEIVGDLLVNKTKEQEERMALGEPKKPLFLLQYTISSHEPFRQRPKWYDDMEKPDFSALYEGEERADDIKNYLEMRYFTDMELGKFMDRMEKEGVLNNTVVLMYGDHGRGPEVSNSDTRDVSVTRVPAAIIAEGRLGESVGLMIDDAVEHYDFLNTMADITGVPEGGFVQDGVGRSLKRKIPFGERVVFSNNPARKMSVVRGHQRLQYDRVMDSVLLHDIDSDHDMQVDLFPNLTTDEQNEWLSWRGVGRDISRYFLQRWDENCLLAVNCTSE